MRIPYRFFLAVLIPFFLTACQAEPQKIHGYVEGETIMIAPTSNGLLHTLLVERGQQVQAGDLLFSLDLTDLTARRNALQAQKQQAEAELNDLLKGERPEEIEIIRKQKAQAEAALINAQQEYDRILPLSKAGASSLATRDQTKSVLDQAQARYDELNAKLKTATMGARIDKIDAAKAKVIQMEQNLEQAEKLLAEAAPTAPVSGIVDDTFFRPGEFVAAGHPVLSLLAPENIKIRFFVPQSMISSLHTGQAITVTCDGCNAPIPATISYISPQSEYTPPVIYSVESRGKLVFLIEAKPQNSTTTLHPGLPVDIDLKEKP